MKRSAARLHKEGSFIAIANSHYLVVWIHSVIERGERRICLKVELAFAEDARRSGERDAALPLDDLWSAGADDFNR
jgi:hypothetical protein